MTKLSVEEIGTHYGSLMNHIKNRLSILRSVIELTGHDANQTDGIVFGELGYLQVRKACEATALATLCAHNQLEKAATQKLLDKYNAEAIFGMLSRINPKGFPTAVTKVEGTKFTLAGDGPMSRSELKRTYIRCHEVLHTGSLSDLLSRKVIPIDFGELTRFHNRFIELLQYHVVPLPELESMIVCILKNKETGGKVQVRIGRIEHFEPPRGNEPSAAATTSP